MVDVRGTGYGLIPSGSARTLLLASSDRIGRIDCTT